MRMGHARYFFASLTAAALMACSSAASAQTLVALAPDSASLVWIDAKKAEVTKTVRIKGPATIGTLRTIAHSPTLGKFFALGDGYEIYELKLGSGKSTKSGDFSRFVLPTTSRMDCREGTTDDFCRFITEDGGNSVFTLPKGESSQILPGLFYSGGGRGIGILGVAFDAAGEMFVIDGSKDQLSHVTLPNTGSMTAVGPLGVDVSAPAAFAILEDGRSSTGYMIHDGKLHKIGLGSGKATKGKRIKGLRVTVTDMVAVLD